VEEAEAYVREHPLRSMASAVVVGFILDRLPIGRIIGGIVRLLLIALKPAILIYGAMKLYEVVSSDEE
jgi:hypothetical protein